jgi:hypothetical protein
LACTQFQQGLWVDSLKNRQFLHLDSQLWRWKWRLFEIGTGWRNIYCDVFHCQWFNDHELCIRCTGYSMWAQYSGRVIVEDRLDGIGWYELYTELARGATYPCCVVVPLHPQFGWMSMGGPMPDIHRDLTKYKQNIPRMILRPLVWEGFGRYTISTHFLY